MTQWNGYSGFSKAETLLPSCPRNKKKEIFDIYKNHQCSHHGGNLKWGTHTLLLQFNLIFISHLVLGGVLWLCQGQGL